MPFEYFDGPSTNLGWQGWGLPPLQSRNDPAGGTTPRLYMSRLVATSIISMTPQISTTVGRDHLALTLRNGGQSHFVGLHIASGEVRLVPNAQVATLSPNEWSFDHKVSIRSVEFDRPPEDSTVCWVEYVAIWTETQTSRFTWFIDVLTADSLERPETAIIKASETIAPASESFRDLLYFDYRSVTTDVYKTIATMPYYDTFAELDGCWIKLGRVSGGVPVSENQYYGITLEFFRTFQGNEGNFLIDYQTTTSADQTRNKWVPLQIQRVPNTNRFRLFHSDNFGLIGTTQNEQASGKGRVLLTQHLNTHPFSVTNFDWTFDFFPGTRTVHLINASLSNIARRYATTDNGGVVQLFEQNRATSLTLEIIHSPIVYEQLRYGAHDELKVQCCSETVDQILPDPKGYGTTALIDYSTFCPSLYLRDPISTTTSSTAICDALIRDDWCVRPENQASGLCACINTPDVPLLPQTTFFDGVKFCFSELCRLEGYALANQSTNVGGLDCNIESLCANILTIEEGSNVTFDEAKQYINCQSTDPNPDPDPDNPSGDPDNVTIWIVVGIIGALLIIIGSTIGIVAAVKNGKKKKKKKSKRNSRKSTNQDQQRLPPATTLNKTTVPTPAPVPARISQSTKQALLERFRKWKSKQK